MKKFWDQLKPNERRWVAIIGLMIFLVINYFMIWPKFKQWSANAGDMAKIRNVLAMYRDELKRKPDYEKNIKELESVGMKVALEDQSVHFETFFRDRAAENNVPIQNNGRLRTRTDEYFLEQQMNFDVNAKEDNLVGLLYSLGNNADSMVRVRSMSLSPTDNNRYQLHATLDIVASYHKKALTPPAPARSSQPPAARQGTPAPATRQPANTGVPPVVRSGPGRSPVVTNVPGQPRRSGTRDPRGGRGGQ